MIRLGLGRFGGWDVWDSGWDWLRAWDFPTGHREGAPPDPLTPLIIRTLDLGSETETAKKRARSTPNVKPIKNLEQHTETE
jgi:hypothetical protein